ncbi:MAG: DUF805 domain-containing protein [Gammaproteobacteria bacterium]|nr:DUF805 domain-containing protein [Gammaproteobacteria bacterium]
MKYFIDVVKKYAVFSGRARRAEYWFFTLFYLIFSIVLTLIDSATGLMSMQSGMGVLSTLFGLALIIPSIAVTIRRLHDSGKSGWWLLFMLIPLLGWIVGLIFMVLGSSEGENKYGANPITG